MTSASPDAALRDQHARPLRNLRLSVTDRCNLRCQYCMPEATYRWLPQNALLDYAELSWVAQRFAALGVRRVRLTGGEPLLRRDLASLVTLLKNSAQLDEVALTTNGLLLQQQLPSLVDAGLDRLTVSLDTLRPHRFTAITQRNALHTVVDAVKAANAAGFRGYTKERQARLKLDTVLMRGVNSDETLDLIAFAREHEAEIRFIEYMDVGGATQWSADKVLSRDALLNLLNQHFGALTPLAGRDSAPAERFRLPDGTVIGIIASTTAPFCSNCDRVRITADGMLYTCLYARHGLDLRTPLRAGFDEATFENLLADRWRRRSDRGAENRLVGTRGTTLIPASALRRDPHLEMHTRGG